MPRSATPGHSACECVYLPGGPAGSGTPRQLLRLGRPRRRWPLIATIALAAACDRPAPMKIDDVHVRVRNSQLMFQYHTQTPTADCEAQAVELPKVWDLVVKAHLTDSQVQEALCVQQE